MKSFFSRLHDSTHQGNSNSATRESYKFWVPPADPERDPTKSNPVYENVSKIQSTRSHEKRSSSRMPKPSYTYPMPAYDKLSAPNYNTSTGNAGDNIAYSSNRLTPGISSIHYSQTYAQPPSSSRNREHDIAQSHVPPYSTKTWSPREMEMTQGVSRSGHTRAEPSSAVLREVWMPTVAPSTSRQVEEARKPLPQEESIDKYRARGENKDLPRISDRRDKEREISKEKDQDKGKSRDAERLKNSSQGQDLGKSRKEPDRERDRHRKRDRERDRTREKGKERDPATDVVKEKDRLRELQQREKDEKEEKERHRERERQRERESQARERERELMEREKTREREREDLKEREREKDRDRERERQREERERERHREEREINKERELQEREKEREREREKERERELKEKEKERERDAHQERERERDRRREREKRIREREREREMLKERENRMNMHFKLSEPAIKEKPSSEDSKPFPDLHTQERESLRKDRDNRPVRDSYRPRDHARDLSKYRAEATDGEQDPRRYHKTRTADRDRRKDIDNQGWVSDYYTGYERKSSRQGHNPEQTTLVEEKVHRSLYARQLEELHKPDPATPSQSKAPSVLRDVQVPLAPTPPQKSIFLPPKETKATVIAIQQTINAANTGNDLENPVRREINRLKLSSRPEQNMHSPQIFPNPIDLIPSQRRPPSRSSNAPHYHDTPLNPLQSSSSQTSRNPPNILETQKPILSTPIQLSQPIDKFYVDSVKDSTLNPRLDFRREQQLQDVPEHPTESPTLFNKLEAEVAPGRKSSPRFSPPTPAVYSRQMSGSLQQPAQVAATADPAISSSIILTSRNEDNNRSPVIKSLHLSVNAEKNPDLIVSRKLNQLQNELHHVDTAHIQPVLSSPPSLISKGPNGNHLPTPPKQDSVTLPNNLGNNVRFDLRNIQMSEKRPDPRQQQVSQPSKVVSTPSTQTIDILRSHNNEQFQRRPNMDVLKEGYQQSQQPMYDSSTMSGRNPTASNITVPSNNAGEVGYSGQITRQTVVVNPSRIESIAPRIVPQPPLDLTLSQGTVSSALHSQTAIVKGPEDVDVPVSQLRMSNTLRNDYGKVSRSENPHETKVSDEPAQIHGLLQSTNRAPSEYFNGPSISTSRSNPAQNWIPPATKDESHSRPPGNIAEVRLGINYVPGTTPDLRLQSAISSDQKFSPHIALTDDMTRVTAHPPKGNETSETLRNNVDPIPLDIDKNFASLQHPTQENHIILQSGYPAANVPVDPQNSDSRTSRYRSQAEPKKEETSISRVKEPEIVFSNAVKRSLETKVYKSEETSVTKTPFSSSKVKDTTFLLPNAMNIHPDPGLVPPGRIINFQSPESQSTKRAELKSSERPSYKSNVLSTRAEDFSPEKELDAYGFGGEKYPRRAGEQNASTPGKSPGLHTALVGSDIPYVNSALEIPVENGQLTPDVSMPITGHALNVKIERKNRSPSLEPFNRDERVSLERSPAYLRVEDTLGQSESIKTSSNNQKNLNKDGRDQNTEYTKSTARLLNIKQGDVVTTTPLSNLKISHPILADILSSPPPVKRPFVLRNDSVEIGLTSTGDSFPRSDAPLDPGRFTKPPQMVNDGTPEEHQERDQMGYTAEPMKLSTNENDLTHLQSLSYPRDLLPPALYPTTSLPFGTYTEKPLAKVAPTIAENKTPSQSQSDQTHNKVAVQDQINSQKIAGSVAPKVGLAASSSSQEGRVPRVSAKDRLAELLSVPIYSRPEKMFPVQEEDTTPGTQALHLLQNTPTIRGRRTSNSAKDVVSVHSPPQHSEQTEAIQNAENVLYNSPNDSNTAQDRINQHTQKATIQSQHKMTYISQGRTTSKQEIPFGQGNPEGPIMLSGVQESSDPKTIKDSYSSLGPRVLPSVVSGGRSPHSAFQIDAYSKIAESSSIQEGNTLPTKSSSIPTPSTTHTRSASYGNNPIPPPQSYISTPVSTPVFQVGDATQRNINSDIHADSRSSPERKFSSLPSSQTQPDPRNVSEQTLKLIRQSYALQPSAVPAPPFSSSTQVYAGNTQQQSAYHSSRHYVSASSAAPPMKVLDSEDYSKIRSPLNQPSQFTTPILPISIPRAPSEETILMTQATFAQSTLSVLKPTVSRQSANSVASQTGEKKLGDILGVFKKKPEESLSQPYQIWHPNPSSKTPESSPGHGKATRETSQTPRFQTNANVAIPTQTEDEGEERLFSNSAFTPFRFLRTRRNRAISVASMEAQDGTAASTVIGSPTASILSTTPLPIERPPLRDPIIAAEAWRDKEEADAKARSEAKLRRQRPGVVFDVGEDMPEDNQKRPRRQRTKRRSSSSKHGHTSQRS